MPQKSQISFINLPSDEQESLLNKTLEKEAQKTLDMGLYIIYTNELCTSDDLFIHEYKNGKKQLIRVDPVTGEDQLVRVLE